MISLFVCIALFSPYVLSSVENCTATKCLLCLQGKPPNCTVSQIDQWSYSVYCESPPITSNCMVGNVTNAYCLVVVDRDNDNGQWTYQGLDFKYQDQHTNCSNIGGNPILPNCLHLYSEVASVEDVGHDIFCRCYEDDCQKRINITFRVIEEFSGTLSPSLSLFSSTPVYETLSPMPSSFSPTPVYEILSSTTSSSITSDYRTSLILPTILSLSTIGIHSSASVTSTILPTSGPHTLTDTLISK